MSAWSLGRHFRILAAPDALDRRHPEFDLGGEHMVVELRLQFTERTAELHQHIAIERQKLPVLT